MPRTLEHNIRWGVDTPWVFGPAEFYILGLGGLDYHLGELGLFVYHCKYNGNNISQ